MRYEKANNRGGHEVQTRARYKQLPEESRRIHELQCSLLAPRAESSCDQEDYTTAARSPVIAAAGKACSVSALPNRSARQVEEQFSGRQALVHHIPRR